MISVLVFYQLLLVVLACIHLLFHLWSLDHYLHNTISHCALMT
jgi:hypothetical protein